MNFFLPGKWDPVVVPGDEQNEKIREDARRVREVFGARLDRFLECSLRPRRPDVACLYCPKTPNKDALDAMTNDEAAQKRWKEQHCRDAHFCCPVCEKKEEEKVRDDSGYKRKREHHFPTEDLYFKHVEDHHKGQHALW